MEDKLRRIIDVGRRAAALLNDETFKTCMMSVEMDLLDEFQNSPRDEAQKYWDQLHAQKALINRLDIVAANGREAERELERLKEEDARRRSNGNASA